MQRFRIKGLAYPGRVNLPKIGTIELAGISDELAEELFLKGCPFLEPVPSVRAEFFPGEIPIEVTPIVTGIPSVTAEVSAKPTLKKNRRR